MSQAASIEGLSSAEARTRLAHDGPNELVPRGRRKAPLGLLRSLSDPMVLLLVVTAPIYFAIGDRTDGIVVLAALVPIAGTEWFLEARAERTLAQLRKLTAPTALVTRDGRRVEVPAADVVAGDVCWLHEGDVVPADGTLIELTQFQADESALTGESFPVAKTPGDEVLAGSTVLSGRAGMRVQATGPRTQYGEISGLVAKTPVTRTPLQRSVSRLVRMLALGAVLACGAVVAIEFAHGES